MAQSASKTCEICMAASGSQYCCECGQLFCDGCKTSHLRTKMTKNHTFISGPNINPEEKTLCQEHSENLIFDCEKCCTPACQTCVITNHKGHKMTGIKDSVATVRLEVTEAIRSTLEILKSDAAKIDKETNKYNGGIEQAINAIKTEGKAIKEMVDRKVEAFIKNLKEKQSSNLAILSECQESIQYALDQVTKHEKLLIDIKKSVGYAAILQKLKLLKEDVGKIESVQMPSFPSVNYTKRKLTANNIDNLFGYLSFQNELIPELRRKSDYERFDSDRETSYKNEIERQQKMLQMKDEEIDVLKRGKEETLCRPRRKSHYERFDSDRETSYKNEIERQQKMLQMKDEEIEVLKREKEEALCRPRRKRLRRKSDYERFDNDRETSYKNEIERQQKMLQMKDEEIEVLNRGKEEALCRLSEIMGTKLSDNNPDPDRPMKIADQFSELYENEWTEAFEDLKQAHSNMTEKERIKVLLGIVKESYNKCIADVSLQMSGIWDATRHLPEGDCKQYVKLFKDSLKSSASIYIPLMYKKVLDDGSECQTVIKYKTMCEQFIKPCVKICYLAAVQDPPMFLDFEPSETYDRQVFREYTKSGTTVDFLVWPALFISKGGSILSKGVVETKY